MTGPRRGRLYVAGGTFEPSWMRGRRFVVKEILPVDGRYLASSDIDAAQGKPMPTLPRVAIPPIIVVHVMRAGRPFRECVDRWDAEEVTPCTG